MRILDAPPHDGALDALRFIKGQVKLICENTQAGTHIEVDMSQTQSYWQPAGNQLAPPDTDPGDSDRPGAHPEAGHQHRAGAPADQPDLPAVFADNITDKAHNRLCTPPGGDMMQACTGDGDVSLFDFQTLPLSVRYSIPDNNATGIARSTRDITFSLNTTLDMVSSANVTVRAGSATLTPGTDYTVMVAADSNHLGSVTIHTTADLLANTQYTVTLTGLKDFYGVAPPSPIAVTFTTAAN